MGTNPRITVEMPVRLKGHKPERTHFDVNPPVTEIELQDLADQICDWCQMIQEEGWRLRFEEPIAEGSKLTFILDQRRLRTRTTLDRDEVVDMLRAHLMPPGEMPEHMQEELERTIQMTSGSRPAPPPPEAPDELPGGPRRP